MDEKLRLIIVLLDRLGGEVTITRDEFENVGPRDQVFVHTPESLQDDTTQIWAKHHGS